MKKIISVVMALVITCATMFAMPVSAQAATSYDKATITSNIKKIKSTIKSGGLLNGNGKYVMQHQFKDEDLDLYGLFILDPDSNELDFNLLVFDGETLFASVMLYVDPAASDTLKQVTVDYWFLSSTYSDFHAYAYLNGDFNHNKEHSNYSVTVNDNSFNDSKCMELCNGAVGVAFEEWNTMLKDNLSMNLGSIGFHIYCKSHSYKTTTTKATRSKNGKIVKVCKTCGYKKTTTIYKPEKYKLSATKYSYNGKYKKPTVTVKDSKGNKLVKGTDYTVSYSDNKNVGEATAKITFIGKYSGSKSLKFDIKPPKTSLTAVTPLKKGFKAKWSKQTTKTAGYQIQYSTSSKFKNPVVITVKGNETTTNKVKKLKSKTKYYVRVRTYKTVNGKKYYSFWSDKKSVTTK